MEDEYLMPITDMLINVSLGHRIISFLDGTVGYNQIFMAEGTCPKWPLIVLGRRSPCNVSNIYEFSNITLINFNRPSQLGHSHLLNLLLFVPMVK